jgi:hypothetical protein
MTSDSLVCQIRAVSEFAINRHRDVELRAILDALQAAREAIEAELAWRKIHAGGAA